ncbi:MAG TPA: hypothetical protein VHE32_13850 [Rhodanobacteraceae bacterium]|jgi:hypothetical protein|nr:hypothetical protein [Rhodanobacteraceae bacterium]
MKLKSVLGSVPLLAAFFMTSAPVHADTFDVRRNAEQSRHADVPRRGMTMAEVERRYGAPVEKLPTAGGDAPRHPPINRWRYSGYMVYFERNRVIHSVVDSAPSSGT